jgi:hypothetical protein
VQHLRSLDLDGQREYLARKAISAWRIGDAISVAIDDYCVTVDRDTITWAVGDATVTVHRVRGVS